MYIASASQFYRLKLFSFRITEADELFWGNFSKASAILRTVSSLGKSRWQLLAYFRLKPS